MAIEFKLPEVSEGVKTADVSDILVSEGDVITAGQVVVEVETEKAVAPVECPYAGKVAKIHVSAGQSIPIGAVLLTIEQTVGAGGGGAGERGSGGGKAGKSANGEKVAAPKGGNPGAGAGEPDPFGSVPDPDVGRQAQERQAQSAPAAAKTAAPSSPARFSFHDEDNGRTPVPAAPSVRRLARELSVDLYQVQGSGRGGRITAEDVRAFAEGGEPTGTGIAAPAGPKGGALAAPARGELAPMAAPQLPDFSQYGPITRQKMNKLARTSAANLSYAWATIPHVTQHDLADITDIEASRKAFMSGPGAKGPKITMTAIMVKAVVAALKQHPAFNSSIDLGGGELVLKDYYHIGIAVDTEAGLVVPVIRDADRKTILQIATELTEIAGKARDRKLQMSDMQGGTFTITNLGGIGGTSFTPIVNYPEVAILGMSRSQTQLRLEEGKVVERLMLPLSLSYDHRVINGADAARFISTLSSSLSDFMRLLVSA
jgi:pyruvate dehydrogenase E2 component (dihydrolipoamide acetyltransferase)